MDCPGIFGTAWYLSHNMVRTRVEYSSAGKYFYLAGP